MPVLGGIYKPAKASERQRYEQYLRALARRGYTVPVARDKFNREEKRKTVRTSMAQFKKLKPIKKQAKKNLNAKYSEILEFADAREKKEIIRELKGQKGMKKFMKGKIQKLGEQPLKDLKRIAKAKNTMKMINIVLGSKVLPEETKAKVVKKIIKKERKSKGKEKKSEKVETMTQTFDENLTVNPPQTVEDVVNVAKDIVGPTDEEIDAIVNDANQLYEDVKALPDDELPKKQISKQSAHLAEATRMKKFYSYLRHNMKDFPKGTLTKQMKEALKNKYYDTYIGKQMMDE